MAQGKNVAASRVLTNSKVPGETASSRTKLGQEAREAAVSAAGQSRSQHPARANELVSVFKALSDPTRLRIVGLLAKGELCVGEIEDLLGVSQTNVSRHLDRLRRAELVTSRRQAQWIYYALSGEVAERHPSLVRLIESEMTATSECASDARTLQRYRASGMSCAELPNCRRSRAAERKGKN